MGRHPPGVPGAPPRKERGRGPGGAQAHRTSGAQRQQQRGDTEGGGWRQEGVVSQGHGQAVLVRWAVSMKCK